MRFTLPKPILFLSFLLFMAIACQDESVEDPIEEIDQDMEMATLLADEYLQSLGGRAESSESSITVFKHKKGDMLYNTNGDDDDGDDDDGDDDDGDDDNEGGYLEVIETTVTAHARPGDFLFWYAGGGVSDLVEIDFDESSDQALGEFPIEINTGHMWVIQIPYDIDPEVEYLKYDIVYQYKEQGQVSEVIRLDPKIQMSAVAESRHPNIGQD